MLPYAPASARNDIPHHLQNIINVLQSQAELDALWSDQASNGFADATQRIGSALERYSEPFRIAIVGEFKSGKSTLVNALLGRSELLRCGVTPTTGAVTEIWYGAEESGEVLDSSGQTVFHGSLSEAACYSDQRTPQGKKISGKGARVILRAPIEILQNLIILDTPGLGASTQDDRVTLSSLELADAAVLVVNGLRPGGEEAVKLTERLRSTGRKFVTVVTRIDQTEMPDASLEAARTVFAGLSDGDPIGVQSPRILAALRELETATVDNDQSAIEAANIQLNDTGYHSLRERIQEGLFYTSTAGGRASRTLSDVSLALQALRRRATREADRSSKLAEELAAEESTASHVVHKTIRPKIPYLDARIDEIVEANVSEYTSDLAEAVDIFIDHLLDKGIFLGLRKARAKIGDGLRHTRDMVQVTFSNYRSGNRKSRSQRRALLSGGGDTFQNELKAEFKAVFSDDHQTIMVERISTAIQAAMLLEWGDAAVTVKSHSPSSFSVDQITDRLSARSATNAVTLTTRIAAWSLLLYVAGGPVFDIAMLLGTSSKPRSSTKIARIKREAKFSIRTENKTLSHDLAKSYKQLNSDTANYLIKQATDESSEKSRQRKEKQLMAERWRQAVEQLKSAITASDETAKFLSGGPQ